MFRHRVAFALFAAVLPACAESLADSAPAVETEALTYFEVHASPAYDGYLVWPVNRVWSWWHVDELDAPEVTAALDERGVIVRGAIEGDRLAVAEAWLPGIAGGHAEGVAVLVEQTGIRCVQAPCEDKRERRLDSGCETRIAELDFAPSGATEEEIAAAQSALVPEGGGLIVIGHRTEVAHRGNVAQARTVTQFYTRLADEAPITPEACEALGGHVRGDIGDGQVRCAADEEELARVAIGIEGGVCCR